MTNSVGGDVLQRFLLSDATPPDSMGLCELDGFLTGIAAGPLAVPMEEWSAVVWGSGTPRYRSAEQRKLILDILARRYADIANRLDSFVEDRPQAYAESGDDSTFIACTWASGFLQAMELRPHAWLPLLQDHDTGIFLLPLMNLYRESADDYDLPFSPALEQAMVSVAAALLPTCARRIKQFWRDRGLDAQSTPVSRATETAIQPPAADGPEANRRPPSALGTGSVPPNAIRSVANAPPKPRAEDTHGCHTFISKLQGKAVSGAGATLLANQRLWPGAQHVPEPDGVPVPAREAVMITDRTGVILSVNDEFTRITGFACHEAVGHTPRILKSSLTSPAMHASFWKQLSNEGHWHGLVWNRSRCGEPFQIRQTVTLVRNAMGEPFGYISVFQKIEGRHILAC